MDAYSLRIEARAERELHHVPKWDAERIVRRILALQKDPRPPGCTKLAGAEGYRIRQGDWRVIYQVDDAAREIRIVKVGHRREIYR
jgi:mRNA interferase RelE/StbE